MKLLELKQGFVLFKKGDVSDAFYIIIDGLIELYDTFKEETRDIRILKTGDSLGERGILKRENRSLTAMVKEDCQVIQVLREDFEAIIQPESKR